MTSIQMMNSDESFCFYHSISGTEVKQKIRNTKKYFENVVANNAAVCYDKSVKL
jgi:hypothetical protein